MSGLIKANIALDSEKSTSSSSVKTPVPGYGRARLWLGISGVGTMVVLVSAALAFDISPSLMPAGSAGFDEQVARLLGFLAVYMLIQLPFDFLGGYWLSKRYGRSHPTLGRFVVNLLRGVLTHGALLLVAATLVTIAGEYAGRVGMVASSIFFMLCLLHLRVQIASVMSQLEFGSMSLQAGSSIEKLEVIDVRCDDEGFTGGIVGVFRPGAQLLPMRWREVLESEGTALAINRVNK